jgi:hypothetical protein
MPCIRGSVDVDAPPLNDACTVFDAVRVILWCRSRNTISPADPTVSSAGVPSDARTFCSASIASAPSSHHHGKTDAPASMSRPPVQPAASRIRPIAYPSGCPATPRS